MNEQAENIIEEYTQAGAKLRLDFFSVNSQKIVDIAKMISIQMLHGGKILICGNGGSAADAQHLAAEFVGKYKLDRPPLPAIALTTDSSILTCISNDYSFKHIFSRQLKGLARKGDVLIGISTSGKSENIIQALQLTRELGVTSVGMVGKEGGEMLDSCDYILHVPSADTPLIQEIHITCGHLLCRLVDYYLFEAVDELQFYL